METNLDHIQQGVKLLAQAVDNLKLQENKTADHVVFTASNGKIHGKGLLWTGKDHTRQFIYKDDHKLWSSENIDLAKTKNYRIDDYPVLSFDRLGTSVLYSSLKTVGILDNLEVEGSVTIDGHFFYDANTQRLGVGTAEPNGLFSLKEIDHEFVIDPSNDKRWRIGCWTTAGLDIITDDTPRIQIDSNGTICLKQKTVIEGKVGVGLRNFAEDADITTAGPVRFQNKKFEVADDIPMFGNYVKGDIVWNADPKPTGYVGWICVRTGAPGEWKAFGNIQQ